jgi:glucose 1-dehydrogenase
VNNNRNKVTVVTGSSRGIGKAIAMEFAKQGYNIVINARDKDELDKCKTDILSIVGNTVEVLSVPGDIGQEDVCISLIEETMKRFKRLDVMINNAGISGPEKNSFDVTSEEWDQVVSVNLKGCFTCCREALKKMIPSVEAGARQNCCIINISSVHESTPSPLGAAYAASKGGMEMLTKTLALEVADRGIRVNGIAPGAIATDMNKDLLKNKDEKSEEEKRIPMHRIGNPEEIAKVAVFLASDGASYITGTTIYADGGLTLVS